MRQIRLILWALVGVTLLAGAALYFAGPTRTPSPTSRPDPEAQVRFGGPFTLVGADGESFSSDELAGKPHAIFFGFTHCPDVCPTTLSDLVRHRRDLGGEEAFDIVFITVDPARDGPEEVGRYADLFGSSIIGLTGSDAQLERAKRQFGIVSIKSEDEGSDYNVDHTANVFLMDADGEFVATISPGEDRATARAKLERIAS